MKEKTNHMRIRLKILFNMNYTDCHFDEDDILNEILTWLIQKRLDYKKDKTWNQLIAQHYINCISDLIDEIKTP